jgi:hypothetical protein
VKDDDFVPVDNAGLVEGSTGDRKIIRRNSDAEPLGAESTKRLSASSTKRLSASASGGLPSFKLVQSLS